MYGPASCIRLLHMLVVFILLCTFCAHTCSYPIALSGLEVDDGATMNRVVDFTSTSYNVAKDTVR
jgi:hypothetical protein